MRGGDTDGALLLILSRRSGWAAAAAASRSAVFESASELQDENDDRRASVVSGAGRRGIQGTPSHTNRPAAGGWDKGGQQPNMNQTRVVRRGMLRLGSERRLRSQDGRWGERGGPEVGPRAAVG